MLISSGGSAQAAAGSLTRVVLWMTASMKPSRESPLKDSEEASSPFQAHGPKPSCCPIRASLPGERSYSQCIEGGVTPSVVTWATGKCDSISVSSMRAIAPLSHGGRLGVPMGTRLLRPGAADEIAVSEDSMPIDQVPVKTASPAAASRSIPSTRASRTWTRVLPALLLFAAILVFVLQNLRNSKVSFVSLSGTLPLGVALLAAVVLGALLVLALGSVRILQLRRLVRRNQRLAQAGERS
jgi:uncharacterized integral membrane protein